MLTGRGSEVSSLRRFRDPQKWTRFGWPKVLPLIVGTCFTALEVNCLLYVLTYEERSISYFKTKYSDSFEPFTPWYRSGEFSALESPLYVGLSGGSRSIRHFMVGVDRLPFQIFRTKCQLRLLSTNIAFSALSFPDCMHAIRSGPKTVVGEK